MANSHPTSTPVPLRIPRYVQRLNALGESHGIAVETVIAPYDDDPELRLWSRWRTTRDRFMSLGLLSRGQHIPSKRGTVSIPGWLYRNERRALMVGEMTSTGDDVHWEIDWGPGEFTITEAGDIEIVSSPRETLYHGTAAALMAHGIERARLPLGKRPSDSYAHHDDTEDPCWWSRRQLDDTIIYRVESDLAIQERVARHLEFERMMAEERRRCADYDRHRHVATVKVNAVQPQRAKAPAPLLRLVVDNTRPLPNR